MSANMKTENEKNLPDSALRAFENYPQISASPDFNRRVLDQVLAARAPSRLEILFNSWADRMDEIFARPILKLLGAACLGGVLALAGTGLLLSFSAPNTQAATPVQNAPQTAQLGDNSRPDSHNRLAMMRELESLYLLRAEYSDQQLYQFDSPAKREKSVEETSANQRSSQCPAAFHDLV